MLDKLELNTKAQELREILGEDVNSPIDIFSIVNQIEGLTLVFYPLGKNISGMCVRDKDIKLIAINSTMSYGRQRYSLAHELYHLFFDDAAGFNVCSMKFDAKVENEKCADQFASYFLAPYKSLREAVNRIVVCRKIAIQDIIALEQYFGMSHLAMLWRLVSEGFLDLDDVEKNRDYVISTARCLGYDDKLYKPTPSELQKRTYGYYLKQVEMLRERDLVSSGKIDELLIDAFRDDIAFGLNDDYQEEDAID